MKVKGTALVAIQLYIREKFGEEKYQYWLSKLNDDAKKIFSEGALSSKWYDLPTIYAEPLKKMCEIFYGGRVEGAWDSGIFSADYALKGIYAIFMKFGSPHFLLKKGASIIATYYQPSKIEVVNSDDHSAIIHIIDFIDTDSYIENRIGGWMEEALRISGCPAGKVEITKSITDGDPYTEYIATW